MAWAYCHKCGHGLPKPTPHEILQGFIECSCMSDEPLASDALANYLSELESRIETLESRTSRIQNKAYDISSFDSKGAFVY